jgi:hypothetical protein
MDLPPSRHVYFRSAGGKESSELLRIHASNFRGQSGLIRVANSPEIRRLEKGDFSVNNREEFSTGKKGEFRRVIRFWGERIKSSRCSPLRNNHVSNA